MIAIACLISVVSQFIFNAFSKYKLPFDIWSKADAINALVNMGVFTFCNFLSTDDFMNPNIKFYLDYMLLAVQLASWMRFISFFLLFKAIANLLLTLMKMMKDAETFFYLAVMYLTLIVVIFMMIF
jgi:hypothetical protein